MVASFRRADRMQVMVRRALSEALVTELDASVGVYVTITDVRMSDDLRHANIFYSCFADDAALQERIKEAMKERLPRLRGAVSSKLSMKYTPQLHLNYDGTTERASRITQELDELVAQADARASDAEPAKA